MKSITHLFFLITVLIWVSSCVPSNSTSPMNVRSETPPILINPTFTHIPVETKISTQPATLTPLQVEKIRTLLREPIDCDAPCFWGITPQQTTFVEATTILRSLGLEAHHTLTRNSQDFYDMSYYDAEKGIEISILLTVQDDIVKNLEISMNVPREITIPRMWSAYSPETLIQRYGAPSRVGFTLTNIYPNNGISGSMTMYFDDVDMIILYVGTEEDFLKDQKSFTLCPLSNGIHYAGIWMGGESSSHPPNEQIFLEQATSLTLEDFAKLMLGKPEDACLNLTSEAFP